MDGLLSLIEDMAQKCFEAFKKDSDQNNQPSNHHRIKKNYEMRHSCGWIWNPNK